MIFLGIFFTNRIVLYIFINYKVVIFVDAQKLRDFYRIYAKLPRVKHFPSISIAFVSPLNLSLFDQNTDNNMIYKKAKILKETI